MLEQEQGESSCSQQQEDRNVDETRALFNNEAASVVQEDALKPQGISIEQSHDSDDECESKHYDQHHNLNCIIVPQVS